MSERCRARLSLIPPGKDWPERVECELREGHECFHGTMNGYSWSAFEPKAGADDAAGDPRAQDWKGWSR